MMMENNVIPYPEEQAKIKPQQIVYRISGCDDRVILIDELTGSSIMLHRPNFYSQVDLAYSYIFKNPNRVLTHDEITENIDRGFLSLTLTEVVSSMGFTGQLRRLFFRVSKNHLIFYNPISYERMQMMQIGFDDIAPFFKQQLCD